MKGNLIVSVDKYLFYHFKKKVAAKNRGEALAFYWFRYLLKLVYISGIVKVLPVGLGELWCQQQKQLPKGVLQKRCF